MERTEGGTTDEALSVDSKKAGFTKSHPNADACYSDEDPKYDVIDNPNETASMSLLQEEIDIDDRCEKVKAIEGSSSVGGVLKTIPDTGAYESKTEKENNARPDATLEEPSLASHSLLPKSSPFQKELRCLTSNDTQVQREKSCLESCIMEANLEMFESIMSTYVRQENYFMRSRTLGTKSRLVYSQDDVSRTFQYTPYVDLSDELNVKLKISSKSAPATFAADDTKISEGAVNFLEENFKTSELLISDKESEPLIIKTNSDKEFEEKKRGNSSDLKRTLVEYDKLDLLSIPCASIQGSKKDYSQNLRTPELKNSAFYGGYPTTPPSRSRTSSEEADIPGSIGINSKTRPKSLEIPSLNRYEFLNPDSQRRAPSSEPAKRPGGFTFTPRKNYYIFFPNKSGILKRCSSLSDLSAFRKKQMRRISTVQNYHKQALTRRSTAPSKDDKSSTSVIQKSPSSGDTEKAEANSKTSFSDQDKVSDPGSKTDPAGRWGPLQSTSRSPTDISVIPQKKVSRKLFCPPRCSTLTKLLQGDVPYRGDQDLAINFDRLIVADRLPPSAIELLRNSGAIPQEGDAVKSTSVVLKRRSGGSELSVQPKGETNIKKSRLLLEEKFDCSVSKAVTSKNQDTDKAPTASDTTKGDRLSDSPTLSSSPGRTNAPLMKTPPDSGGVQQKRDYEASTSPENLESAEKWTFEKQEEPQ